MSYYRRLYYYRRRRRSPSAPNIVIGLLALFTLGIVSNIKAILTSPWFYVILAIAAYFIFRKFWRKKKTLESPVASHEIAEINSEKHGCKCYMEDLLEGEREVAHLLARELSYKDYFLFNNLIIPSETNGSTQVDHVVVSKFGIFVIESKDYQGWIFGSKDQDTWTQSLPRRNKFQFQNPIHQNYAHIMALKALLPFVGENFHNIVVFSNKSEFKTEQIENVVNLTGLIECIKKHTQEKLTDHDLQLVIGKLSFLCQTLDISLEDHIANLHTNHP